MFTYDIASKQYTIKAGNAYLFPPNMPHHYLDCSDDFLKLSIAFKIGNDKTFEIPDILNFGFDNSHSEYVNRILKLTDTNDIFTPIRISNLILEIIYSSFTQIKVQFPQRDILDYDPRFIIAEQYISNNKRHPLTSDAVAKECSLSLKQLNRIFKKHTNKTVNEYINNIRASYVRQLVLSGKYSIKEITILLGFSSESSLINFFKRHFGVSPKKYCSDMHTTEIIK